jgi:hypothetical protein
VTVGLVGGAALALNATAGDAGSSGSRLSAYLQVVRTRADSYDADGSVVRSVLMPYLPQAQLKSEVSAVDAELGQLGSSGTGALGQWQKLSSPQQPQADYVRILDAVSAGDTQTALAVETGTGRGDAAFDFFDYDQSLQSVSTQRLADFQSASNGLSTDVGPWLVWPWILAGVTLVLIALAFRPRLAEYS